MSINAKFDINQTVQVVGTSGRVILNRSVVINRVPTRGCIDLSTGLLINGDSWGYELDPKPPMRLRYVSENNLRPIPEAGSKSLDTLMMRCGWTAGVET